MKAIFAGLGLMFAGPAAIVLLFAMWRHPWESAGVIGIIILLLAAGVYEIYERERAPAIELDNADTAKAKEKAARYALLDAWKPRSEHVEIEGQWPATKLVAKHVRHPSGVGLKLNRD